MPNTRQTRLFHQLTGNRHVTAPFRVDASEAVGNFHRFFWRLLSYRYPKIPARMGHDNSPAPWHFEMVVRDEKRPRDLHLVLNPATDRLEEASPDGDSKFAPTNL